MAEEEHLWEPFSEEHVEVFRLWFEFLKLTDIFEWRVDVLQNFGDLTGSFEKWWPAHSYLFKQIKYLTLAEITTETEFRIWREDDGTDGEPGTKILAVPMWKSKAELMAAFEQILTKYHKGARGRPEFISDGDVYSLYAKPDIDMLNKILAVYKFYKADRSKPKNDHMPLWQIEEEVSKITPLILKTGRMAEAIWKTEPFVSPDGTLCHIAESRRRSQLTTVKKYLNYAEQILKHVIVGEFPVLDSKDFATKARNMGVPERMGLD
jgi:hypothetical protein